MQKLLVLMPTRGLLMTEVIERLEVSCAHAQMFPIYMRTTDLPVDQARNNLWERASMIEWDYCLMIDDDIAVHADTISRLAEHLATTGDDFVAADYPVHNDHEYSTITGRKAMTVTTWRKWEGKGLQGEDALWTGLGCVMMTPEGYAAVCEYTSEPFQMKPAEVIRNSDGSLGISFDPEEIESVEDGRKGGEDSYFFLGLRKRGLKWSVLPNHLVIHLRVDKFIGWLANSRYVSQHTISRTESAEVPYNVELKGGTNDR